MSEQKNITKTEIDTQSGSAYEYHGGSAPPKATDKVLEPKVVEEEVKEAIVHENITAIEREEIQPIIERERLQTEIVQVVQPVLDVVTEAPTVEKVQLEEETHKYREKASEEDIRKYEEQAEAFSEERREEVVHEKVYKAPIIHEVVKTKVITEVQPVIERVINKTHVIEETQNIKETFVKAPIVHEQQIAAPISMSEFAAGSTPLKRTRGTSLSPSPSTTTTLTGTPPGPMTRLKRKKLAEAAEGPTSPSSHSHETTSLDITTPTPAEPSTVHGTLEKIVGVVEAGVGELLGSDRLVVEGEMRKAGGEEEIREAKRRRVERGENGVDV
ncbi:uncharacterized protein EV422DRAFT_526247 [Fimicolochytrium jonesii]|uniref:uncharacterized protein n=1 Tax=Fimicolochytrium jonesii TaxID=1396493 RepID=UPI0022FF1099|nr:uncharacterized protein EV422DRAFT_526247 [Fimicolochytrium jonesii]KAI8822265.1 hypothetical protein EV422DRAFT_526247 [Fimicolochytrium jonesii]